MSRSGLIFRGVNSFPGLSYTLPNATGNYIIIYTTTSKDIANSHPSLAYLHVPPNYKLCLHDCNCRDISFLNENCLLGLIRVERVKVSMTMNWTKSSYYIEKSLFQVEHQMIWEVWK